MDETIAPLLARSLKGEASPEEEDAVRAWRRASPENDAEYRQLARLVEWAVRLPERLEIPPRPSAAELIRRGSPPRVIDLRGRFSRGRRAWLAAAAAVVALLGAYLYRSRSHGTASGFGVQELVTSDTETSTLELQDGTVIRLAPSSRLRVLGGRGRREVALEGRSFLAVAQQHGAPFVIRTGAGEVTVLGTRIDVEARGRDLRLVVVEGRAALSTPGGRTEVTAGEMGRILNGEAAGVVKVPDVGSIVGWTGTFLAFQSTPLGDAAREIERVYGVRVEIQDDNLAQRVITAWFWDKSLAEVLDVVCLAVAARCSSEAGVVRIEQDVHGGGR